MSGLYSQTGLPEIPELSRAFNKALEAGIQRINKTSNSEKKESRIREYEKFILDMAGTARLLFAIKDDVPQAERIVPAISNYVATYATYSGEGLRGAYREFGVRPVWFTICNLLWLKALKSTYADYLFRFVEPSLRNREFQTAMIVAAFNRFKDGPDSSVAADTIKKQMEHYRRVYPQALRLLRSDEMPEPLKSGAQKVLQELPNVSWG